MKRFITGFIVGALIFSMVGAFAATYVAQTVEFKVLVNGEEFESDPPALAIEGRTYLPLRAIGDALGVPVEWNTELGRVEVGDRSYYTDETINGYKTYKESKDIIDFGDYCKSEPLEVLENDTMVSYVYSYDMLDFVVDYMVMMKDTGYTFKQAEDGLFAVYSARNYNDLGKKGFTVGFGQPDTSSLKMYVIVSVYK